MDKVQRGDERYLALLTEEYEVLREEKRISTALGESEQTERESFNALSSAVRESHERERGRAERTKYWSIIGSVIGATIGIVGSSINNYRRNRELRSLVRDSAAGGAELNRAVSELVTAVQQQQDDLQRFLSAPSSVVVPVRSSIDMSDIIEVIRNGNSALEKEITDTKRLIATVSAGKLSTDSAVVYIGPEVKEMFQRTEELIGNEIRKNTLLSSTVLYTACLTTSLIVYGVIRLFSS